MIWPLIRIVGNIITIAVLWWLYHDLRRERARAEYWREAFYKQVEDTTAVYRRWSESIREAEADWPPPPPGTVAS